MYERNILIFINNDFNIDIDLLGDVILSFDDNFVIERKVDEILIIKEINIINESICDFEEIRNLVLQDFHIDLKIIILPYLNVKFMKIDDLIRYSNSISNSIYYLNDLIPKIIIDKEEALINYLRKLFIKLVGEDCIKNAIIFFESNLNSTIASKTLQIHRNTLNYQLDKINDKTGLNPRTFKGANSLYMLFVLV